MAQFSCEVDKNILVTPVITEISGYGFALYEDIFSWLGQCISTKILHRKYLLSW